MTNRAREIIDNLELKKKDVAAKMGITSIGLQQLLNTEHLKIPTLENLAKGIGVPTWKLILSDEEIDEIYNMVCEKKKRTELACPHCGKPIYLIAK